MASSQVKRLVLIKRKQPIQEDAPATVQKEALATVQEEAAAPVQEGAPATVQEEQVIAILRAAGKPVMARYVAIKLQGGDPSRDLTNKDDKRNATRILYKLVSKGIVKRQQGEVGGMAVGQPLFSLA